MNESIKAAEKLHDMFNELVPVTGKCDTLAGEIIRAVSRLGHRFNNDGDMVNVRYGKETCNAPARFLEKHLPGAAGELVHALWMDGWTEEAYDIMLAMIIEKVHNYIVEHPELRETETEDMWDYFDKEKDKERWSEDEDKKW